MQDDLMKLAQSNSKALALWIIGMMVHVSLGTSSIAEGDEPNSADARPNASEVGSAATGSDWDRLFDLYFTLVLPPEPDAFKQPSVEPRVQKKYPLVQNISASDQFATRRRTSETLLGSQWTAAETERPGLVPRQVSATNFLSDDPPLPPGVVDSVKSAEESEAPAPTSCAASTGCFRQDARTVRRPPAGSHATHRNVPTRRISDGLGGGWRRRLAVCDVRAIHVFVRVRCDVDYRCGRGLSDPLGGRQAFPAH